MIEYGDRTRTLPAPPAVVWESLTSPHAPGTRSWLILERDEVEPVVLEGERPGHLVWSSMWPERPDDRIELTLSSKGADTALRFRLLAAGEPPDESTTGHIRRRMNVLLWADLRYSYGQ